MIHNVYAIFDSAAGAYLPPFCVQRDAAAIRAFTDAVNSPSHQFHQHAKDFSLHHLGTFDDSLGKFEGRQPAPHCIATGLGCLIPKAPDINKLEAMESSKTNGQKPAPVFGGVHTNINEGMQ